MFSRLILGLGLGMVIVSQGLSVGPRADSGVINSSNTKITWVGTKKAGSHKGGFAKVSGKVEGASGDLTNAKISVEIDTESLTSDNGKLTTHLKSADFFETKKHPTAKFVTTAIEARKSGDHTHEVTGELTLKDKKSHVTFPAKLEVTGSTLVMDAKFKLSRKAIGITYGAGQIDDGVSMTIALKVPLK